MEGVFRQFSGPVVMGTFSSLIIRHVKNNGKEHRSVKSSMDVYQDALAEHQPDLYQVLCHNCNFAKYQLGECPHQLVNVGE